MELQARVALRFAQSEPPSSLGRKEAFHARCRQGWGSARFEDSGSTRVSQLRVSLHAHPRVQVKMHFNR